MKAHFSKRRLKIQSTFVQGAPKIFNIASEASYVYILSGQKLIKNTKYVPFWRVFENLKLRSNSVTRQVSFNRTKIGGKCQNKKKSNATFLSNFQTMCISQIFLEHPVYMLEVVMLL